MTIRPRKKKFWFSSAPLSNFYKQKRATFLVKYSVLGNTCNAFIFLMISYFCSPSSFFKFVLMRTKTFIFQFQKKKRKKENHASSFFNFFLMRTKRFIFHDLIFALMAC